MPKLLRKKNMLFYEERGKIGTFSFTFSAESKKGEQDARKRISIKIEEEN